MPTTVGILTFISWKIFILSWVHCSAWNLFITSGTDFIKHASSHLLQQLHIRQFALHAWHTYLIYTCITVYHKVILYYCSIYKQIYALWSIISTNNRRFHLKKMYLLECAKIVLHQPIQQDEWRHYDVDAILTSHRHRSNVMCQLDRYALSEQSIPC